MKATNCDRYGCTISGRRITYDALRRYVCDECGGAITHRFTWDEQTKATVDSVACAACGGDELITETRYAEQISDGWEVEQGLPAHLRELLETDRGGTKCQSATEATDDLFG